MSIRFLSLADQEIDDAVLWYEELAEGLSRDFLDDLDRTVRLVVTYPDLITQTKAGNRQFRFARYPYSLVYAIDRQTIVVLAVARQRHQPRYWVERI